MIESFRDAQAFVKHGCTFWDMPEKSDTLVEKIIPDFLHIVRNPPKENWAFDNKEANHPDLGLIIKNGEEGHDGTAYDIKTYLHFNPALLTHLGLSGAKLTSKQRILLDNCGELHALCMKETEKFAALLEKETFSKNFAKKFELGTDHILRLLAYRHVRTTDQTLIGEKHVDRSCFTLALRESAPGLEGCLDSKGPFDPIGARNGHALVFPGGKLEGLGTRCGNIRPLWHRITLHEPEAANGDPIRWAVVFFAHGKGFKLKMDTHDLT